MKRFYLLLILSTFCISTKSYCQSDTTKGWRTQIELSQLIAPHRFQVKKFNVLSSSKYTLSNAPSFMISVWKVKNKIAFGQGITVLRLKSNLEFEGTRENWPQTNITTSYFYNFCFKYIHQFNKYIGVSAQANLSTRFVSYYFRIGNGNNTIEYYTKHYRFLPSVGFSTFGTFAKFTVSISINTFLSKLNYSTYKISPFLSYSLFYKI